MTQLLGHVGLTGLAVGAVLAGVAIAPTDHTSPYLSSSSFAVRGDISPWELRYPDLAPENSYWQPAPATLPGWANP